MVTGVTEGYRINLEMVGVGYRAALKGSDIELQVGFSHPVLIEAPAGIDFEVSAPTKIGVSGIDKQLVGQIAADIRKDATAGLDRERLDAFIDTLLQIKANLQAFDELRGPPAQNLPEAADD